MQELGGWPHGTAAVSIRAHGEGEDHGHRRLAGWVWCRGAGAVDVAALTASVSVATPGVFSVRSGFYGVFIMFAAESRSAEKLDGVRGEADKLVSLARCMLPAAETYISDEVIP